jgi:hypothetical protein
MAQKPALDVGANLCVCPGILQYFFYSADNLAKMRISDILFFGVDRLGKRAYNNKLIKSDKKI